MLSRPVSTKKRNISRTFPIYLHRAEAAGERQRRRLSTLYVLVDHILETIEPLHDPDGVPPLVSLQLFLRRRHGHSDVDVGDVISDPSDVEQAHDVGHAAQDHACGHQSFGLPGASHPDIPACGHRATPPPPPQVGEKRKRREETVWRKLFPATSSERSSLSRAASLLPNDVATNGPLPLPLVSNVYR